MGRPYGVRIDIDEQGWDFFCFRRPRPQVKPSELQLTKANNMRHLIAQVTFFNRENQEFYRKFPFCKECGCRAPLGHEEHFYGSVADD